MLRKVSASRAVRAAAVLGVVLNVGAPPLALAAHGGGCPTGNCPVNSREFGYFETRWRHWPGTEPGPEPVPAPPNTNTPVVQPPTPAEEAERNRDETKSPSSATPPAGQTTPETMPPPDATPPVAPGGASFLETPRDPGLGSPVSKAEGYYPPKPAALQLAESKYRGPGSREPVGQSDASLNSPFSVVPSAGKATGAGFTPGAGLSTSPTVPADVPSVKPAGTRGDHAGLKWRSPADDEQSPAEPTSDESAANSSRAGLSPNGPESTARTTVSRFDAVPLGTPIAARPKPSLVDRLAAEVAPVTSPNVAGRHLPLLPTNPSAAPAASPAKTKSSAYSDLGLARESSPLPSRFDSPPPALNVPTASSAVEAELLGPAEVSGLHMAPPTHVGGITVPKSLGAGQTTPYKAVDESGKNTVGAINPLEISSSLKEDKLAAGASDAKTPAHAATAVAKPTASRWAAETPAATPIGSIYSPQSIAPKSDAKPKTSAPTTVSNLFDLPPARLPSTAAPAAKLPSNTDLLAKDTKKTPIDIDPTGAGFARQPEAQPSGPASAVVIKPTSGSWPPLADSKPTTIQPTVTTATATTPKTANPTTAKPAPAIVAAKPQASQNWPALTATPPRAAATPSIKAPNDAAGDIFGDGAPATGGSAVMPAAYRAPLPTATSTLGATPRGAANPLRGARKLDRNEFSTADWSEIPAAAPGAPANPLR